MENNEIFAKLCNFAKISGIISVCILGAFPAFGLMALAVPIVLKNKGVQLDADCAKKCKIATILGSISLVMFVIDFVVALIVL